MERTKELYKKYRPSTLEDIIGQEGCVEKIQKFLDKKQVPHSILFTGPSGCGKTTLARILQKELDCADVDFKEINGASTRGIDDIRALERQIYNLPIGGGKASIILIDEAGQITPAAQDCLLKPLEDTPSHMYFFLATTDPQKLKKTIKTRCTEIKVCSLTDSQLTRLIKTVCISERIKIDREVLNKILYMSEGSARKALVLLDAIRNIKGKANQLNALETGDTKTTSEFLGKLLLNNSTQWPAVSVVLREIKERGDDPEGLRRGILGYAAAVALNNPNHKRACAMYEAFRDNFFDTNFAGLVFACREILE